MLKNLVSSILVLLSLPVFGLELDAGTIPPAPTSVASLPVGEPTPSVLLSVGSGLSIFQGGQAKVYDTGRVGYSLNAGLMGKLTYAPIYGGVDFGLNFWKFGEQSLGDSTPSTRSAVGIRVLPSLIYRFSAIEPYRVAPYFGFSFGPHVYVNRKERIEGSGLQTSTSTDLYLEFLVRPGADFHLAEALAINTELKFGVLNYEFIFVPQVNMVLAL